MNIFSKKSSQKPEGENKRLSLIKKKVTSTLLPSSLSFGNHNSHPEPKTGFSVYSVNNVSLDSDTLNAVNNFAQANDLAQKRSYIPKQPISNPNYDLKPTERYKTSSAAANNQNTRRIIQASHSSNRPQSLYNPGPQNSQSNLSSFQNNKNITDLRSENRSVSNGSIGPLYGNIKESSSNSISSKTPYLSYLNNSSSSLIKTSFSSNNRTPAYISNAKQSTNNKINSNYEWSLYDSNPVMKTNPKYSQSLNSNKTRTNSVDSTNKVENELISNRSTSSNLLNYINDSNLEDCGNNTLDKKSSISSRGSKSPRICNSLSESNRGYNGSTNRNGFEVKDNPVLDSKQRQQNAVSQFNANFLAASNKFDHTKGSFYDTNDSIQNKNKFNYNDFNLEPENKTDFINDNNTFSNPLKDTIYDKYDPLSSEYSTQTPQFPEHLSMLLPNSGVFDQDDILLADHLPKINDNSVKPFEAYLNQSYTNRDNANNSNLREILNTRSNFMNDFLHNDFLEGNITKSQTDEDIYDDAITPLPNSSRPNQHKLSFVSHRSSDSTNSIQNFFGSFVAAESDKTKYSNQPTCLSIDSRSSHHDAESICSLKDELKKEIESELKEEMKQEIISELKAESKEALDYISSNEVAQRTLKDSSHFDDLQYNEIIKGIDKLTHLYAYDEESDASNETEQHETGMEEFTTAAELLDSKDLEFSKTKLSDTNLNSVVNFFYPEYKPDEANYESKPINLKEVEEKQSIKESQDTEYSMNKEKPTVNTCAYYNNTYDKEQELGFHDNAVSTSQDFLQESSELGDDIYSSKFETENTQRTPTNYLASRLLEEKPTVQPSQKIIRKNNYLSEIEALANESYDYSNEDFEDAHVSNLNYSGEHNSSDENNNEALNSFCSDGDKSESFYPNTETIPEEINVTDRAEKANFNESSNLSETKKSDGFNQPGIAPNEDLSQIYTGLPKSIKKNITLANINKMKTIRYVRKPIPNDDYEKCSNSKKSEESHNAKKEFSVSDIEKPESQTNPNDSVPTNTISEHSKSFEKEALPNSTSENSFSSINNMHNNNNFDYYNACRSIAVIPSKRLSNQKTYDTHGISQTNNIQPEEKKNLSRMLAPLKCNVSSDMLLNITAEDLAKCEHIYNASEIYQWLCLIAEMIGASIFLVADMLSLLCCLIRFNHSFDSEFIRDMAGTIILELISQKCFCLVQNSRTNKKTLQLLFNKKPKSVFVGLTSCISYSCVSKLDDQDQCYFSTCPLTKFLEQLKVRNIIDNQKEDQDGFLKSNWIEHWKMNDEELALLDKEVIEYQSRIFDLVRKQYDFLREAEYMVHVLGNEFLNYKDMSSIIYPYSVDEVYSFMFEPVKPLISCHREYLFEPMMKIINIQKQYVKNGIFVLYRSWTKKVFPFYVKYIDGLANVLFFMNFEKCFKRDSKFLMWLKQVSTNEISAMKLLSNHFFYGLVQYKNSLEDIRRTMNTNDPEYPELVNSHKIIFKFCEKIDQRLGRAQVYTLFNCLIWSDESKRLSLNYDIEKIDLLYEESVQLSNKEISSLSQYNLILLSNSLFLVEIDINNRKFKIIDKPIPIELILYETIEQTNGISVRNLSSATEKLSGDPKLHLKICGLGLDIKWNIQFLKASSRNQWIQHINDIKNKDTNTALDNLQLSLVVSSIPLVETFTVKNTNCIMDANSRKKFISASYQITDKNNCPAVQKIFCVISFNFNQQKVYFMGADSGMFVRTHTTPWRCICDNPNVTKIQYIPQADSIIYLTDKKFLHAYCHDIDIKNCKISSARLSKRPVDYFVTGLFKGVFSLFYMKVKIESPISTFSTFKSLIWDERRNSFKESKLMELFFLPVECLGWTVFDNFIVFNTSKGFQMMDDTLKPISLPRFFALNHEKDAKGFEIFEQLERRVIQEKSIAAFQIKPRTLSLLVFTSFAVFCNENGFIANTCVLNFNIEAKSATIFRDKFLFIFNESVMEVYDLNKSPPKLVGDILGNNIEMINHGNGQNTQELLFETLTPDNCSKMILELIRV